MSFGGLEMETAPETASFRHYRRRMWQAIRTRFEEAVVGARMLGLDDDEACKVAARSIRGDIRAFMSELLTLAPVPALLEFLPAGRDWGTAGERLFQQSDAVTALIDSAYPRPTWTELGSLSPQAAEDDAQWSAWATSWAATLGATDSAAEKALAPEPATSTMSDAKEPWSLRRWAPWLASAAAVISATTIVVATTRK
ncbi:hypothetical protein [Nannocystis bainbridge]|uniref:Uncharacterized protein n=1 Tax=Nannocystis bainbridge TaxID=2995303 RepID=A0ABT5E7U6_9BACT|nr:hypothetical protein [Nannocystis bainbridge]MDC0720902.1 hypothetical protein [Nannocystis bainbridge]